MEKKWTLDRWCDKAWIKSGFALTMLMAALILANWEQWTDDVKILASVAALIPIHVIEEWVFPERV